MNCRFLEILAKKRSPAGSFRANRGSPAKFCHFASVRLPWPAKKAATIGVFPNHAVPPICAAYPLLGLQKTPHCCLSTPIFLPTSTSVSGLDQMVYHLDRSENALVDPWAITTTTGLSEQWFDNTYVKCGTKNSCKWKCVRDQNNEYQCVESETTFDWEFITSQAYGANCP